MTTEAAEAEVRSDEASPGDYGRVIIEWPAPHEGRPLPGWGCSIFDAETGRQIVTVEKIAIPAVTADASGLITCWLTMFADPDGKPLLFPERRPDPLGRPGHIGSEILYPDEGCGGIKTGVFPFSVAEMRVRS
jgi:hypothetical protein